MPGTQYANKVRLKFDETLNDRSNKIRDDLSTVARSGKYLWLAFDEGSRVERLKKESITYHDQVERLANVTLGHETEYGTEKAEGLVLTDDHRLMVVYDTPCEARKPGEDDTYADIFNYE